MKQAVTRTRENLSERIEEVISFTKEIDRNTLDDLEAILIGADLGTTTTQEILDKLREKADRKQIKDVAELKRLIKEQLLAILNATPAPRRQSCRRPAGSGHGGRRERHRQDHHHRQARARASRPKARPSCCAPPTPSAPPPSSNSKSGASAPAPKSSDQKPGGDPAAVLFDALSAAKARKTDYVIVDTAGRLHTKTNLMAELEKMQRTAQRIIPGAPHEVLLVLDATTGQNGLEQARKFTEAAGVTGIVLTKLDGTAKGGVVVAISRELGSAGPLCGRGREGRTTCCRSMPRILSTHLFSAACYAAPCHLFTIALCNMAFSEQDELFMRQALELARRGTALTSPGPRVGAVIADSHGRVAGNRLPHL